MIKIAPSVLSASFLNLESEIKAVQDAGADILHLDIMDGHFVPNLTFGMPIIKQIIQIAKIPLDVHLMVENPKDYLRPLGEMGISYVSFHLEAAIHAHRYLQILKDQNVKAGIALNPSTPVELLFPILPELDFVLLMSVNPGFGGQKMLDLIVPKLQRLKAEITRIGRQIEIEVDGGINSINASLLKEHGAEILVAGSYIFQCKSYKQAIDSLR
jgi:ribulose-phosphate 3-epimerase